MPERERERRRRGRGSTTSQAQPAGGSRAAANHRIGNAAIDEQREPPGAIGYVGLNPRAREEARALERSSRDQVIASLDRPGAERRFDTVDEQAAFIEEVLGIDFYADTLRYFLALQCLEACDADFREQWRYVNVRRLFNFVEKSIERSTQWVVFEPNNPDLWARVKRDVTAFLTSVWRTGALFGSSPSEAFQVVCDESNNPPEERDQGRLFIDIGLAAVKPAEFVVFRFQQITGGGE